MRAEELDLKELLDLNPGGGLVRFAGQRALIFDAVAQGLLRKELIDTFGVRVARGILSRFGYVHGRRIAEAMRSQFKWDTNEDWQRAGSKIYALQGLFMLEPDNPQPLPGLPPMPPPAQHQVHGQALKRSPAISQ